MVNYNYLIFTHGYKKEQSRRQGNGEVKRAGVLGVGEKNNERRSVRAAVARSRWQDLGRNISSPGALVGYYLLCTFYVGVNLVGVGIVTCGYWISRWGVERVGGWLGCDIDWQMMKRGII